MSRSQFGHIRKHRNTGKWRVFWHEGSKQKSKVVETRNEATKLLAQLKIQEGLVDTSISLVNYYNNIVKPSFSHLAERTAFDYKYTWSKIRPIIGDSKIADITRHQIQRTIDRFDSPKMQEKIFILLRKILNSAVEDSIIIKNPCNKTIKRKKVVPRKKTLYDKEQLKEVLMKVKNTEWAIPVLLECVCGLRHEEFCALNKRNFKFDKQCIYIEIQRALTEVKGKLVLKEPKTSTSYRTVVIIDSFEDYLLEHTDYLTNKRTLSDYPYPLKLTKRWRRYCNSHDIPYVTFGNMRTVYATLCSEAGCVDSIVCKTMGHTGKSIKERNYQSTTIQALKLNAKALSDYIGFNYKTSEEIINKRDKLIKQTQANN